MPDATQLTVLCDAADVDADTPVRVEASGTVFAVFCIGGRHYVTQDACTHGPGSLAEGFVDGEEIECPFHQGRFHVPTGRPSAPPCTVPLRNWEAHLIDGKVCIDVTSEGDSHASQRTE
ncbi:MAG TPA: non-heme iron oxygenase ferredoxin subunit [Acetobacteraceae bacterium]|jgi:nitrite reductase/ring-hydroxylating ferredoxin subunit|nr:non-heme iron oxygenase ferredoxin subunit [Acetobacteraceae bacterium]